MLDIIESNNFIIHLTIKPQHLQILFFPFDACSQLAAVIVPWSHYLFLFGQHLTSTRTVQNILTRTYLNPLLYIVHTIRPGDGTRKGRQTCSLLRIREKLALGDG